MRRFNEWLADRLAVIMSTMWLFWALVLACLIAYAVQPPNGAQGQILFWVSIMFQGIALPVLAFVSNKQGDATQALLLDTHNHMLAEVEDMRSRHALQAKMLEELRVMHAEDKAWRERVERAVRRTADRPGRSGRI